MENSGNSSNQSRFLIAAVLSMAVLFGWQYFYAPKKPADNTNTAANTNTAQPTPAQPTPAAPVPQPQQQPETAATTPDTTPNYYQDAAVRGKARFKGSACHELDIAEK